jgi:F0F1-type ATP synthase epsilon subunit
MQTGGRARRVPVGHRLARILPGDALLMVLLGTGTPRIDRGREQKSFTVSGGFPQVVDNQVTILSESAAAA